MYLANGEVEEEALMRKGTIIIAAMALAMVTTGCT